jgi:Family of unknown function (DUF6161)
MLQVDFGDEAGGRLEFADRQAFDLHISTSLTQWSELLAKPEFPNAMEFYSHVSGAWTEISQLSISSPAVTQDYEILALVQRLRDAKRLVSLESNEGATFREILSKFGKDGCICAYTVRTGASPHFANSDSFLGSIFYGLVSSGVSPAEISKIKHSTESAITQQNDRQSEFNAKIDKKVEDFQDTTFQRFPELDNYFATTSSNLAATQASATQFLTDTKKSWEKLRDTFATQLAIEAPVKYWQDKAVEHKGAYEKLQKWPMLIGGFGMVFIGLVIWGASVAINFLLDWFLNLPEMSVDPMGQLFVRIAGYKIAALGAVALFAFTMYIWSIRFVMRLMMTEHHLSIDASARATMANTYLALNKDGAVSENEKTIILAALFKPVTDGIVRDDGMPTISPASMIANQLSKPQ